MIKKSAQVQRLSPREKPINSGCKTATCACNCDPAQSYEALIRSLKCACHCCRLARRRMNTSCRLAAVARLASPAHLSRRAQPHRVPVGTPRARDVSRADLCVRAASRPTRECVHARMKLCKCSCRLPLPRRRALLPHQASSPLLSCRPSHVSFLHERLCSLSSLSQHA